jgi:hypothetical protein
VRGVLLGKVQFSFKTKLTVFLIDYQKVAILENAKKVKLLTSEYGDSFLSRETALHKVPLSSIGQPEKHEDIWLKWKEMIFPPGSTVRCLMASLPITPSGGSTLVMHGRCVEKDIGDGFKWKVKEEIEVHVKEDDTKLCWTVYSCLGRNCPATLELQCKSKCYF